MTRTDGIAEIAGQLTRTELGIRDDTRPARELTPLGKDLPNALFTRGDTLSWLIGRKEEAKPLDPRQLALAKLCLKAYSQQQEDWKTRFSVDEEEFGHYGESTKIVGKITVSPVGPEGRYMVNFTATNSKGENDWRATASTFMFDVQPSDLDTTYGAREDNLLVGDIDGKPEIIGDYKSLFKTYQGKVAEALQKEGVRNIGEVWAADTDRHAGFLTQPPKSK